MKAVISIGTDSKMLDGGRVYERVKEYANIVDGFYFCFVFTDNDKHIKYEKKDGNFIVRAIYGKSKLAQIYCLYSEIKSHLKSEIIWYPQDSFEIGVMSLIMKYIFGGKLYTQCHTDISHKNFRNLSYRNFLQYLLAQIIFRKADKIRVVSNRMKKYLIESLKINEGKILSLPIYFDLVKARVSSKVGDLEWVKKYDFLIMSRIEKEKNIETAIEALESLGEQTGEYYLLKIVGDGSYKEHLQNKYRNFKSVIITWSHWTDNPNQEYQNAKYFLLPSFYEGWGLTAIESVNCGTPVIMTNVGCAHEVINNYANGVVAEGFGVKEFKEAISKALETNFSKENLRQSVLGLDTKEEYLYKLKIFLSE